MYILLCSAGKPDSGLVGSGLVDSVKCTCTPCRLGSFTSTSWFGLPCFTLVRHTLPHFGSVFHIMLLLVRHPSYQPEDHVRHLGYQTKGGSSMLFLCFSYQPAFPQSCLSHLSRLDLVGEIVHNKWHTNACELFQ